MKKELSVIIPTRPNIDNITAILGCLKNQSIQNFQVFLIIDSKLNKDEYQELKYHIDKSLEKKEYKPNSKKGSHPRECGDPYNTVPLTKGGEGGSRFLPPQEGQRETQEGQRETQEGQRGPQKGQEQIQGNKKTSLDFKIVSNINYDFQPQKNASATRNYGIKLVNTPYLYLFDDDNIFADDHLDKTFRLYTEFNKKFNEDFVVTSTLMYRRTGNIQNQGFKKYNYWMSRPKINFLKNKKRDTIRMYSGNGLFGPSHIFQETLYDETLDFVAEDLDFTYRITKKYPMIVHCDLKVYHMERKKTYLEHARVGNPFGAYRKAKHRIIFAKKHASTWEKIQFYTVGLWGNSVWLVAKILIFGGKQRWEILKNFWKGTWDGLREKV